MRSWLLPLLLSLGVVGLYLVGDGPWQLGCRPLVYADESVTTDGPYTLLEEGRLRHGMFSSRPELEPVLEGEGELTLAISAGYYVTLAAWSALVGEGITEARLLSSLATLLLALVLLRLGRLLSKSWWPGALAAAWWLLDSSAYPLARTVRPDIPTALCYVAAIWLSLEPRAGRWRPWLSGALLGLGGTMHPVGVVVAPVVALFQLRQGWRSLLPFSLAAALPAFPYALLLIARRDEIRAMLELNAAHRPLAQVDYFSHLATSFSMRPRTLVFQLLAPWRDLTVAAGLLALGGWVGGLLRLPRRGDGLRLLAWALLPVLLYPFLARDYLSHGYHVHLLPGAYLAAACGIYLGVPAAVRRLTGPRAPRPGALGAALAAGLCVWFPGVGARGYLEVGRPLARDGAASYEVVSAAFAPAVPAGSLVLGTPNAAPLVREAEAIYLHNDVYQQFMPPYRRYPVHVQREEGNHLSAYRFDVEVLRALRASGREVFFHLDMADWAWNACAPFGRPFGQSYAQLRRGLRDHFGLVARGYAAQRGRLELWRFGAEPREPRVYVEGAAVSLGPLVPVVERGARELELPPYPGPGSYPFPLVASFATEPGKRYWLELVLRVPDEDDLMVCPIVDGESQARWYDSPDPVAADVVRRAGPEPFKVELFAARGEGRVVVERVELREVSER